MNRQTTHRTRNDGATPARPVATTAISRPPAIRRRRCTAAERLRAGPADGPATLMSAEAEAVAVAGRDPKLSSNSSRRAWRDRTAGGTSTADQMATRSTATTTERQAPVPRAMARPV